MLCIRTPQQDLWDQLKESSPLNPRAWALQERLISPRILHYSRTQLFWECAQTRACETYPEPVPNISSTRPKHMDLRRNDLFKTYNGLDSSQLYAQWIHVVEIYTATFMTKLEDKLVALSGLAKAFQKLTKDVYCAGIWRGDLAR